MKKIICPVCKAEYSVQEIFIPEAFMGTIREVDKDDEGKIIEFYGKDMDLKEEYRCDYCNSKFTVNASVNFKCTSDMVDFNKDHVTKLKSAKLRLNED